MIPASEQQTSKKLISDASISVKGIDVGGNVQGSIIVGSENVVGNDNIVVNAHDRNGAVVNIIKGPQEVHPHGLPGQPLRSPRGFTGRQSYLDQLDGYIQSNERVLVYGQDGIGKTALLAQASNGNAVLSKPDGVVYLEGIDEEGKLLGKGDIIQRLFDTLYQSSPPLKVTFPTARPYLSNRQPVVFFDHLSSDFSMKDLTDLSELFPKGAVLVTSEDPPGDDALISISLPPLAREESIQMFGNKSGFALEETTRPWIDRICDLLGDVPLAIAKTANYIRVYGLTLKAVADGLAAIQPPSQDRIQAAIERSFGLIYPTLNKQEREMLAITAAAPGNSVDRPWLESVAGGETTSQVLESLELLVANSPRLRLPEGIKHILQSGRGNLHAQQELLLRHLLNELKTRSLDFKFVEDELGNILGLLQWASNEGRWSDVIALGRGVDPYLTLHGFWDAWEYVLKQVLAAAQNLKDLAVRGWALHQLGTREIGVGTKKQAINLLLRALKIHLSHGDLAGAAYTLHNLRLLLPPETKDQLERKFDSTGKTEIPFWQEIWRRRPDDEWIIPLILAGIAVIILLTLPLLSLTKEAHPIRYHDVGQVIEYSYIIDNSLFAPIQGPILVKDDKFMNDDGPKVDCPEIETIGNGDAFLNWNERMICRAFYTITGEDVQNGSVTNTAIASARDINSGSESVTITFDPKYLTLRKTANTKTYSQPGDMVTFTYLVRNGGDVILQGPVRISDDKILNNQVRCQDVQTVGNQDDAFDPDELLVCRATYTIKEADTQIDPCSVTNTAIASAGGINSEPDSVTIYCEPGPLILSKSVDREIYQDAGERINYTYVITNRGLKPLSGPVTVQDDKIPVNCPALSSIGNGDDALDPNESLSCTATYIVTQYDIDGSCVTNTAIANAGPIRSRPQSVTVCFEIPQPVPPILTKLADPEAYESPGDEMTYTYVVTNPGNGPLKGPVTVHDDKISADKLDCPALSTIGNGDDALDPPEIVTCTAIHRIISCPVTNTAFASVGGLNSELQSVTIYCKDGGELSLTKTADRETYRKLGDEITYTYFITNRFKGPLKGPVTVTDEVMGKQITVSCPAVNTVGNHNDYLDPNDEQIRCTAEYPITQPDMDNGSVTNIAFARIGNIISNRASVTIYEKALELKKSAKTQLPDPKTYEKIGDPVSYSYDVTGRSKLPLRGRVIVIDDKIPVNPDDCPALNTTGNLDDYLDWGETITCTAPYSITQGDMDHGSVTNTATARVGDVISNPDTATITGVPKILLRKTADRTTNGASYGATYDTVDQKITYTYEITNTGIVTLRPPFMIRDDHIDVPIVCGADKQSLAPKEWVTCKGTYNIKEEDFQAESMPKSVTNTATASVIYGGKEITSTATATITCGPPANWVVYFVQDELQLGDIAQWYSDTAHSVDAVVVEWQKKNCMGSKTAIFRGKKLYLPSIKRATIRGFIWNTEMGRPLQIRLILTDVNGEIFSGEDGSYEISGLEPSTYSIFQTSITLSPGEIIDQLNFTIIPQR